MTELKHRIMSVCCTHLCTCIHNRQLPDFERQLLAYIYIHLVCGRACSHCLDNNDVRLKQAWMTQDNATHMCRSHYADVPPCYQLNETHDIWLAMYATQDAALLCNRSNHACLHIAALLMATQTSLKILQCDQSGCPVCICFCVLSSCTESCCQWLE